MSEDGGYDTSDDAVITDHVKYEKRKELDQKLQNVHNSRRSW